MTVIGRIVASDSEATEESEQRFETREEAEEYNKQHQETFAPFIATYEAMGGTIRYEIEEVD